MSREVVCGSEKMQGNYSCPANNGEREEMEKKCLRYDLIANKYQQANARGPHSERGVRGASDRAGRSQTPAD